MNQSTKGTVRPGAIIVENDPYPEKIVTFLSLRTGMTFIQKLSDLHPDVQALLASDLSHGRSRLYHVETSHGRVEDLTVASVVSAMENAFEVMMRDTDGSSIS